MASITLSGTGLETFGLTDGTTIGGFGILTYGLVFDPYNIWSLQTSPSLTTVWTLFPPGVGF